MKRAMMRSLTAALLGMMAAGGTTFGTAEAHATEWHTLDSAPTTLTGTPLERAARLIDDHRIDWGLASVSLSPARTIGRGAITTLRHDQQHKGLDVVGAAVVLRMNATGTVTHAVTNVARDLNVDPNPSVLESQAATTAVDELSALATIRVTGLGGLAVLPDGHGGRLVWRIDAVSSTHGYRIFVDAHAGQVVRTQLTFSRALGRVYPQSSVATPTTQDVDLVGLDDLTPQVLTGFNGQMAVTNYVSGGQMSGYTVEQVLEPNVGGPPAVDFLYDPPTDPLDGTDGFAQVGVFYHLGRARSFFETMGVDFSAPSWKLTVVANLHEDGNPVDNAFFAPQSLATGQFSSPNFIAIGQGTQFDFAQDSDVFIHEYTHYVNNNAIGFSQGQLGVTSYGLSPWGGSIGEGTSDFIASHLNNDSLLGEASLALLGSGRELTDTAKTCPADIVGEVHADGEIIGSFSWSLRVLLGADLGADLVWGATTMLTPNPSLGDFARAVQSTADDMLTASTITATERAEIDTIIATRGLDECDEELPLREGEPRESFMFGMDLLGQAFGAPCAQIKSFASLQSLFHYESTVEPGDRQITFSVDMQPIGSTALEWGIYVRKNEHVGFVPGMFLPTATDFDYRVEGIVNATGELTIDENSDPPFDPTATYHMVIVHKNCASAQPIVSVDANGDPPATTAAGVGGAGGAGGSGGAGGTSGTGGNDDVEVSDCDCDVAGGRSNKAPSGAALLIGLAAVGIGRRRRRR